MSALLVPPGRGLQERGPAVRLETITAHTYRAFLSSPAGEALGAGFLQCPSWADVKEGWRAHLLGWGAAPAAGELTGVALVLLRQFPGTRKYFAYLPEGPVADWSAPDIDSWLAPLLEHLRGAGAFAVRMGPSPAYRSWDAARLKASTGPGRRLGDVLAGEVDPLGTAVAERLRARAWHRCGEGGDKDTDAQP
ncbi:aminoacyltransferase, partial [Streptomyces sp. SID7982]|nr:aminoacyltransferase [Streptomyces sp. SID7982]